MCLFDRKAKGNPVYPRKGNPVCPNTIDHSAKVQPLSQRSLPSSMRERRKGLGRISGKRPSTRAKPPTFSQRFATLAAAFRLTADLTCSPYVGGNMNVSVQQ